MVLAAGGDVSTAAIAAVATMLVTAFGYALWLLSSGTTRVDNAATSRATAAEEERDRAIAALAQAELDHRDELAAQRTDWSERYDEMKADRDYWRNRRHDQPSP